MSLNDGPVPGSQHVSNRKYHLCENLSSYDTSELITSCPDCSCFFAECCQHPSHRRPRPCHHFRLAFTDGACLSNGDAAATSGIGVALGLEANLQLAVPVNDSNDPGAKRSSQRAELLAAFTGLRLLDELDGPEERDPHERLYNRHSSQDGIPFSTYRNWIIATDSQYVVDGMTDWLPNKWKPNGLRAFDGRTPANLDLFLAIDQEITVIERERDVRIGFWHVPRKYNAIADKLAKEAARCAPATSQLPNANEGPSRFY